MSYNGIDDIGSRYFIHLRNLFTIDLSHNQLKHLGAGAFLGLHNLRSLLLIGNSLLRTISPGAFQHLHKLPSLILSSMNIEKIEIGTFTGLQSLQKLDLSNNSITEIQQGVFEPVSALKDLNLSLNPLSDVQKGVFIDLISLQHLESDDFKFCCFVYDRLSEDQCLPSRDEFSSCEDLMRRDILKVFLWVLGGMAFFCNIFVIIWRWWDAKGKLSVYSFSVMHLAAADFLMGAYMLTLGCADLYFRGVYIEHAKAWKSSTLCQFLGFLNTLSSEASVFVLCVISADRFYKVVFPLQGAKFNLHKASITLIFAWLLAFTLAIIPLFPSDYFGSQYYSRSSVCLSLHITNDSPAGWQYSVAVFHGLNFLCFLFIFFAYSYIYIELKRNESLGKTQKQKRSAEAALARKLFLVVATDFMCWVPINIMGK